MTQHYKECLRAAALMYSAVLRNRKATVVTKEGMKEFIVMVEDLYKEIDNSMIVITDDEDKGYA